MSSGTPTGAETSYDRVPYPSHAFPQTHPDRLSSVGMLFGMEPAAVEDCRVLEIGCASGGNLIPMAEAFPRANFIGIDLSHRQIATGVGTIESLGLANISLRPINILAVDASLGEFDYVICHGIYSWVPRTVQDKILEICRQHLKPQGIAYVSYNTYPGWHMREMIRDMMCYHSGRFDEPQRRVREARALLDFLAKAVADDKSAYAALLQSELQLLTQSTDSYLFHEHLEEVNQPLYFHQFVERAREQKLAYLGEAIAASMWSGNLPEYVRNTIIAASSDAVQLEQYMDFVRNRTFRQTLLCHERIRPDRQLTADRIERFFVASPLKATRSAISLHSASPETFVNPSSRQSITTTDAMIKAALILLAEAWPASIHFAELFRQACEKLKVTLVQGADSVNQARTTLAGTLVQGFAAGHVELHTTAPPFVRHAGTHPRASAVARRQAKDGAVVTTRRHEPVKLSGLSRHVLPLLDGTRSQEALIGELEKLVTQGTLIIQQQAQDGRERQAALAQTLADQLAQLARLALLEA